MDTKRLLKEAARNGKVDVVENLLEKNPAILADFRLESPLHEATKCQQLRFVRLLIKIDSDGAGEIDKNGFRPLDIAVIMGNMDIVIEILGVDQELYLLKGKDGRSAFHHAAIRGRVDIMDVLLNSCPDSIGDVTFHGETALHLAVKNHQFDAFTALLKC